MQAQTSGLLSAMDCFSEGIMLVNTATASWDVLFVNDAWSRITSAPHPPLPTSWSRFRVRCRLR